MRIIEVVRNFGKDIVYVYGWVRFFFSLPRTP
jgi:hypothetical protein